MYCNSFVGGAAVLVGGSAALLSEPTHELVSLFILLLLLSCAYCGQCASWAWWLCVSGVRACVVCVCVCVCGCVCVRASTGMRAVVRDFLLHRCRPFLRVCTRCVTTDAEPVEQIALGLYIIRGDNMYVYALALVHVDACD
jgi:hypothetical protein